MKRTLKKAISVFLVVTILLCVAPLNGFVGLELLDFFSFASKAAESEICPGDGTGTLGHDWSNNDGICARDNCDYECAHPEDEICRETIIEPTCVPGLERATCNICNIHAPKTIDCAVSTYPESEHSYANGMNKTWEFKYDGALKLTLIFSSSTKTESGYDYIYIYNSKGSQVGKYSGTQLSSEKIELEGDSFSIKLTSDGSNVGYGFSFDSIKADIVIDGLSESETSPVVEHNWSDKTGICSNGCGTICSHLSYTQGICDVCGGNCTTLGHVFDSNNKCVGCAITGGSCGEDLIWILDEETGEFSVSGTGKMFEYSSYSSVPWYSYCSKISSIVINSGVESIGGYAFYGCTKAKEIKIANSVENIGTYAFYNCSGLTYIEIPASTKIYNSSYTFYGCSNITKAFLTSGTGTMKAYGTSTSTSSSSTHYQYTPWYISRNKCTEIVIENGVTNIGNYAFYGATGLVDVNIPNSVVSLGNYSFMGCTSITDITIPNNLETIGSYCFNGCTKLQEINIPITVTDIGTYAFYNCSALSKAYFPGTLDQWNSINVGSNNANLINRIVFESESSQAYYALGTCGENLSWILYETGELVISGSGDMTDYSTSSTAPWYSKYASKITSVTILEGVTSIGAYAFYSCSKIEDVNIAEGVTVINKYAFYNCSSIEKLIIPKSVTSISDYSFYGCQGIVELSIPASAKIYNSTNTFYSCNYIKKLTLTKGTGTMQAYSNSSSSSSANTYYQYTPWYKSRSYCSEIVIEDGIENIGTMAFMGCYALKNIEIPDSVTSIGESSFNSCNGLTEIVVPASVVSISNSAFNSCSGLKTVKISEGVETIGSSAFSGCTSLNNVYVPESLNSVAQNAFYNCSNILYTYYPGTPEEWNGISISTSNNSFTAFVVYECDSSKPYYGTGSCGDSVNWILYLSGELIISGTGEMKKYTSSSSVPWYNYNQRITSAVISDGVETLSDYSFYNCINLEELTIPVSTKIFASSSTAYECESVKKVTFTVGNGILQDYTESTSQYTPWYKSKANCKEVVFEDGVKNIGNYAFYGCGISTVSLPADLENIGNYAFSGCSNLAAVELPESLESIGEYAFQGLNSVTEIVIPDNVTAIGKGAFNNMSKLTSITLPFIGNTADSSGYKGVFGYIFGYSTSSSAPSGTIFQISDKVNSSTTFTSCYYYVPNSLRTVTITEDVTIPDGAFRNCSFLTTVELPNNIVSIGDYAFNECSGLPEFTLPDTVESIGEYAFDGTSHFTNISNWENKVLYIGKHLIRAENAITGSYTIKENTLTIAAGAFERCKSLETVNLCDNIMFIPANAFYGCTGLSSMVIPDSVRSIGEGAFYYCGNLKELTMPISAQIYNSNTTFYLCENIEEINFTLGAGVMPTYSSSTNNAQYTYYQYTPWYISGANICLDIVIPKGVTTIGAFAFYNCTYLTTIYYEGTKEEFNNITINNYNNPLLNANYVYGAYKTYWKSGNSTVEKVFTVGEEIIAPDVPSLEGYSIIGWTPEIPETMPAESLTFMAVYEPNVYNAIFDANGGNWLDGSTRKEVPIVYGTQVLTPEQPKRVGYVFSRWSPEVGAMDNIGGKTFVAEWIPSTATAYTVETYTMNAKGEYDCVTQVLVGVTGSAVNASYSILTGYELNNEKSILKGNVKADNSLVLKVYIDRKSYEIKTVVDGVVETYTYLYGAEISDINIPSKNGFVFDGWDMQIPDAMPAENITLNAKWVKDSFDATWLVDGVETKETYTYGSKINTPAEPTKTGYTFTGWGADIPASMPAKNLTFTAQWTINSYNVTWIADGVETKQTYKFGDKITAPKNPSKEGHTFVSWSKSVPATMPAEDLTFTAVWDTLAYDVIWVVDGIETKETYNFGATINAPSAPAKTGYTFAGWDNEIPTTMPSNALTFTAKWNINSYDVIWVVDGVETKQTYQYGADVTSLANPSKEGYTFTGWSREVPTTMPAENVTITAHWQVNTYTVTWVVDGASTVNNVNYGANIVKPATPVKPGYKFVDWTPAVPATMPAQNLTFTAQFELFDIQLKIKNPSVTTINYGETLVMHADFGGAELPEGWSIKWTVEGSGFSISPAEDGLTCKLTSITNGNATVKATVVDEKGEVVLDTNGNKMSDNKQLLSKAGFFQKLASFFKNLFGISRIILQSIG